MTRFHFYVAITFVIGTEVCSANAQTPVVQATEPLTVRASNVGVKILRYSGAFYLNGMVQGASPFCISLVLSDRIITAPQTTACSRVARAIYQNTVLGNFSSDRTCNILLSPNGVQQSDSTVNKEISDQFEAMKASIVHEPTGTIPDPTALQGLLKSGENVVTVSVSPFPASAGSWSIDVQVFATDSGMPIRIAHMDNTVGVLATDFHLSVDAAK
jgi:hypothetical protein